MLSFAPNQANYNNYADVTDNYRVNISSVYVRRWTCDQ